MVKEKIESILSDVSNALPKDFQHIKEDVEKNLRASLNASFAKLELVTREEFDVQSELLQRTRKKLDELQEKLTELEKEINKTDMES